MVAFLAKSAYSRPSPSCIISTLLCLDSFRSHSLALRVRTIHLAKLLSSADIYRFCFRIQLICILKAKIWCVICLFLYSDVCIPPFWSKQPLNVTLYTYITIKTFMTVKIRICLSRIQQLVCCYCCKRHWVLPLITSVVVTIRCDSCLNIIHELVTSILSTFAFIIMHNVTNYLLFAHCFFAYNIHCFAAQITWL